MSLKKIWYNVMLSATVLIGWANLLSKCTTDVVEKEREEIAVTVAEILETKKILDEMSKDWICETVEYKQKANDWVVDFYWYRCKKDIDWKDRKKDYVVTVSNLNNEYIWNKTERCKDKRISYWSLWDRSPTMISAQSIVTYKWETITIDDASCKKLLNLVQT